MSSIGASPLNTSLVQTAQAQQSAAKARDRERAATERGRRFQDLVELRVAGVEAAEALRRLPSNDSEQASTEHEGQALPTPPAPDAPDDEAPHIDVQA